MAICEIGFHLENVPQSTADNIFCADRAGASVRIDLGTVTLPTGEHLSVRQEPFPSPFEPPVDHEGLPNITHEAVLRREEELL